MQKNSLLENIKNSILIISGKLQVREKTGLSSSTIYKLISDGEFPKPIKLSIRSSGWVEPEVDDWIDERLKEREEAAK